MAPSEKSKMDIKSGYKKVFEISLIISLSFLIVAFVYFPRYSQPKRVFEPPPELIDVEDIVQTKLEKSQPIPPKPVIPVEAPSIEELDDIVFSNTEIDLSKELPTKPPVEEIENTIEYEDFFVVVEEIPEPIGGMEAIKKKIVYPEFAKRANVHGKVFITAYVDENGEVKKTEILKGIGAGCDEEAIKAIMQTKFKPGKQRGKPVKVKISIPIQFTLQ
ncbi:MAG: energy transducer TonB [Melioribacteraceae bacterium]|nr:energy transducer TonB [Melioribacteraceae bacterium]